MGYDAQVTGSSQHQTSSPMKEKVIFPRASRSHKLQDKVGTLRSEKPVERLSPDPLASRTRPLQIARSSPTMPLGTKTPRQRLNREGRGVDELIKYMSKVPAYLQLLERGDTNQEKALNMGVIDWGHLQKWTDRQKPVGLHCDVESPSSHHGSISCESSGSSCVTKMQQSSSFESCQSSYPEEQFNQTGQKNYQQFSSSLNMETTSHDISSDCPQLHKADCSKGNDKAGYEQEKRYRNDGYFGVSGSALSSKEAGTFSSTSHDISSSTKCRDHLNGFQRDKLQVYDHICQNGTGTSPYGNERLHDESKINERCVNSLWGNLQDTANGSNQFGFESTLTLELDRNRFSGPFLSDDAHFITLPSDVPYSCPLPSNTMGSGWEDPHEGVEGTLHDSPQLAESQQVDEMKKNVRSVCRIDNDDNVMTELPRLSTPKIAGVSRDADRASTEAIQKPLPNLNLGAVVNGMLRNSSVKEVSARKQSDDTNCLDNPVATSRARRSPLRRMLDPLLKSRSSNRCPVTSVDTPVSVARRLSFSDRSPFRREVGMRHHQESSSKDCARTCGVQEQKKLVPSTWKSNSHDAFQNEKHATSKRQALLRLAWKNELPLFTFSMNDTDILVATKKKTVSDKKGIECSYTFFYVREMKKKSGGWINQGNKNKRQELVSKVVGKMNVRSCPLFSEPTGDNPQTRSTTREFILLGSELRPTALQNPIFLPDSELAAIVVRSPPDKPGSSSSDSPHFEDDSSLHQAEYSIRNVDSDLVAILPREVHGLSDAGAPSPLIRRWKSGGSCDCGGWDVGCSLAILTDNNQQRSSTLFQSSSTTDGTHRAELFIEGGARESRPVFSLVAFNEGLYTVDFDSSIAVLQVFSICIAILHSRKPSSFSKKQNTLQQAFLEEKDPARTSSGVPASYVPHHPPLSPVGRA